MTRTVAGLFDRWAEAQAALHEIEASSIRDREVSIVGNRQETVTTGPAAEHTAGEAAMEGAGTGAETGAMIGTGLGLLAGLGALTIPGFGPVVAAGPIMAVLTGAGVGAATGAVAGGLVGALGAIGVPREHAVHYEEGVRRGGTLLLVKCSDLDAEAVVAAMNRHNAVDIEQRSKEYVAGGSSHEFGVPEDAISNAYRHAPTELGGRLHPDEVVEDPSASSGARELAGVASEERELRTERASVLPAPQIDREPSQLPADEADRRL